MTETGRGVRQCLHAKQVAADKLFYYQSGFNWVGATMRNNFMVTKSTFVITTLGVITTRRKFAT